MLKNSILEAVEYAKKIAKKQDIIVITGSLFTVGEARDIFFVISKNVNSYYGHNES